MELYEYIIENESETKHFYYSWEEKPDNVVASFIKGLRQSGAAAIDIIDVFPEPHVRDITLGAPLLIHTKCGRTMYLPENFKVTIHGAFRILFEFFEEE